MLSVQSQFLLLPGPNTVRRTQETSIASEVSLTEHTSTKPKVLIVDDDPILVKSMERVLQTFSKNKFNFVKVFDPLEAIKEFKKGNFSAVITDLRMPGMNGVSMASKLKEIDGSVKIILVTGSPDDLKEQSVKHINAIVVKPYEGRYLLNILELALSLH